MAVGKAGEPADRDKLRDPLRRRLIAADGLEVPGYDETPVAAHMKGQRSPSGRSRHWHGQATVWTCDLTHGYIDINGDYRS